MNSGNRSATACNAAMEIVRQSVNSVQCNRDGSGVLRGLSTKRRPPDLSSACEVHIHVRVLVIEYARGLRARHG